MLVPARPARTAHTARRILLPAALALAFTTFALPGATAQTETAPAAPAATRTGVVAPTPNLVVEGIPPIPAQLAADLRAYTEARAAAFNDWHPTRHELLISTRFGNTAQLHLVQQPLGMRRQLTFFEEPVGGGSFDPLAGEFFIFSRDAGGSEFHQLYRHDFADGRVTLLSDGGRSQNRPSAWSPDHRLLAYSSTRRNGSDRDLYLMDPRDPQGSDRLVLQVSGGGWGIADWSPDGATWLVSEFISVNESHLWLLDLADGRLRELTPRARGGVAHASATFTRDGKAVLYATDLDSEFRRLFLHDLTTGQARPVTAGFRGDVRGVSLAEDGRRGVFIVSEDGVDRAYLLDLATLAYAPIPGLPIGQLGGAAWHRDSRHVAFNAGSARAVSDVHVLDADTGRVTRWTESELGGLVADTLAEPELVKWTSFDGLEISGFLYRPPARFEGPRPVIINIHGGPEAQALPVFLGRNNYFLNELGVAMIFPNVRGSTGFGKTFVTLDNGKLREDAVKDIGALLDWIALQPELDASRVMVTGVSYGGYMTLASAVHYSDRLRCALNVVGISNFITFLENTESYRRDLRRVEYGDERDPEMRAFFERISPLNHAERITIPMFIVQGANDPRVPRGEAIQMVERIRAAGGTVWYLEAKDEGHGFRKKANADFQFYATVMFVREHLLP